MVNFPPLQPSSRRVSLGAFPVKRFTSMAGTGTTRVYGSQPHDASMDLEFANRTDADAASVVAAYEDARGEYEELLLPIELWDGMALDLRGRLQRDYVWRFNGQPQLVSGPPGISSISVKLSGTRDI